MKPTIALLGTGLMGAPIGHRLLAAGFELTVWNRTPAKTESLVVAGARAASSPAQAAVEGDIVVSLLANGPVVEAVLSQVEAVLRPGTLWLGMSSIPPPLARDHARRLADRKVEALDAPVSGGVVGAHDGRLAIMVGGEETAFARAQPLFAVLGRAVRVGPAGTGALAKLANQLIVGLNIGAVAEALLLAQAGGADPEAVRAAIRGGFAESRVLELHGQRMLERNFVPGAHCTTQLKDLDSALAAAREYGLTLPLTDRVSQLYRDFIEFGGQLDHSALWLALERLNGRSSLQAGTAAGRDESN